MKSEERLGDWNEHNELKVRGVVHTLLYILDKTSPLNLLNLLKIMYFADQKHLVKHGLTISGDDYHAMEFGPVASTAYAIVDCLREGESTGLKKEFSPNIFRSYFKVKKVVKEKTITEVSAKRSYNPDSVRKSGLEFLNESIKTHRYTKSAHLSALSHGSAWTEAWKRAEDKKKGSELMGLIEIAEEVGASKGMLEYIGNYEG